MMFSCCCAIVDISWKGICDCHSGIPNTCETKCLREKSLSYDNSYFNQLKVSKYIYIYIYIFFFLSIIILIIIYS